MSYRALWEAVYINKPFYNDYNACLRLACLGISGRNEWGPSVAELEKTSGKKGNSQLRPAEGFGSFSIKDISSAGSESQHP